MRLRAFAETRGVPGSVRPRRTVMNSECIGPTNSRSMLPAGTRSKSPLAALLAVTMWACLCSACTPGGDAKVSAAVREQAESFQMPGYEIVGRNEWTGHDARMVVNLAKIAPRTPANAAEVCVDLTSAIAALPNWTPR